MATKAKHPTIKDLRQGKVLFQVHDQNKSGNFEVRILNVFSIPRPESNNRYSGGKYITHAVKCDMPLFDLDGKPLKNKISNVSLHQLIRGRFSRLFDSTFDHYIYTTRRAAERAAKNLNEYIARQDRYVHTIGVYPNGNFLEGIKTNNVDRNHIVGHVHYNVGWRPGRALIVNNKIVYDGNVDREKLKQIIEHYKQNPPKLDRDTAPYH